jgi:hypothetical protein
MTPLETVQKGYDLFLKGDVTGLIELFKQDSTFTPMMGLEGRLPLVTPKGTFGRFELGSYFGALSKEMEFLTWENRQWVSDGNTVVVLGRYAGKNKRTGKPFASEFAHVLTIEDGMATSFKEFADTAALLEAATA